MRDVTIAFTIAGTVGLVVGTAGGAGPGATVFAAIFTTLFTVLDRRRAQAEQRHGRQREAELQSELDRLRGQAPASVEGMPPPATQPTPPMNAPTTEPHPPRPDPMAAVEDELTLVREQLSLPLIDWRRTVAGAGIALAVIITSFLMSGFGVLTFIAGLFAVGFWVGRTSRSSGFLGSGIAGGVPIGTLAGLASLSGDLEAIVGLAIATGVCILLTSLGGWAGSKTRQGHG